ncbi:MAG: dynamin family protein [Campylobacteraceae bacterium]|jgi:small GTP-binding protein|nr:dynamin family protein [Campylobacteraceae bacterium]
MGAFEDFISEYKAKIAETKFHAPNNILKLINEAAEVLFETKMLPSKELKEAVNKLKTRAEEPMKVALTGQFSSGKSTFLNALLAKNILPTGITPVTSKVNYIRYGGEFSLMVKYKDGRESFHGIESIKSFTDQRNSVEDIDYLTLYAPLELLKHIVFVDTPGLNSQSFSDTETTEAVLKEVDGIIWLSLIDNAGKMSEEETLEQYMHSYQNKSLCVLNQKDKFSPEQIKTTTQYIKNSFKKYFAEVIPISAKQALESRSGEKQIMLEGELKTALKKLKADVEANGYEIKEEFARKALDSFKKASANIAKLPSKESLLKESNIEAALDFICQEIKPIAIKSKEFAITHEIKRLLSDLIEQEVRLISVFEELEEILNGYENHIKRIFAELKSRFSASLNESYLKIEEIIDKIASEILSNKTSSKRVRYAKKRGFFGGYEPFYYEAAKINSDEIYKKLFFDDDLIGKMFKRYLSSLQHIQNEIERENMAVFKTLEEEISKWQKPYELIRKSKNAQSDIQFANMRKFASKSYENILKPFHDETAANFAKISSEFRHASASIKFNYQNATEVVIAFLERRIEKSIQLYEENPAKFSVHEPKLDEIRERLQASFHLYEFQNMMKGGRNFIAKNYDTVLEEFFRIKEERLRLVAEHKAEYVKLKHALISLLEEVSQFIF